MSYLANSFTPGRNASWTQNGVTITIPKGVMPYDQGYSGDGNPTKLAEINSPASISMVMDGSQEFNHWRDGADNLSNCEDDPSARWHATTAARAWSSPAWIMP